jgi:hypothetical protein
MNVNIDPISAVKKGIENRKNALFLSEILKTSRNIYKKQRFSPKPFILPFQVLGGSGLVFSLLSPLLL